MNTNTFNKSFFIHRLKLKIELMDGIFNTISVDTGITEERISQLINEINAEPTVTEFYNICNWLNLPMNMFFGTNSICTRVGHDYSVSSLPGIKNELFAFDGPNSKPIRIEIGKYDAINPWESRTPLNVTNSEMKIPFTANSMHVVQVQKPLNRKERRAAKRK